jgi:hypothetical protein
MVPYLLNLRKNIPGREKKIVRAGWDLPAKKHNDSRPFPPKLGYLASKSKTAPPILFPLINLTSAGVYYSLCTPSSSRVLFHSALV